MFACFQDIERSFWAPAIIAGMMPRPLLVVVWMISLLHIQAASSQTAVMQHQAALLQDSLLKCNSAALSTVPIALHDTAAESQGA